MEKIIEYTSENQVFWEWTEKKIQHDSESEPGFHFYEREIWWAALGKNIGHEMDGKNSSFERPVLILKKFSHSMCLVLPLTTKVREENENYFKLPIDGKQGAVVLPQPRTISIKRLINYVETVKPEDFSLIKEKFNKILA
ncbi:MAG: type II toxin-antitoxin system PemK/MazF family toxin [Candidatus Magasanikbacteria bacterium]|nr:type II toxin-antitoxin system PemK/MazF family toxin [Candidatus Magasanikbacteria bacterium]